jgi:hypothetical protein
MQSRLLAQSSPRQGEVSGATSFRLTASDRVRPCRSVARIALHHRSTTVMLFSCPQLPWLRARDSLVIATPAPCCCQPSLNDEGDDRRGKAAASVLSASVALRLGRLRHLLRLTARLTCSARVTTRASKSESIGGRALLTVDTEGAVETTLYQQVDIRTVNDVLTDGEHRFAGASTPCTITDLALALPSPSPCLQTRLRRRGP